MGTVISGARIPEVLQKNLKDFCQGHGLKISYFVSKAIEEKLREAKENEKDIALFEARKDEAEISEKEMDTYLKSLRIDV